MNKDYIIPQWPIPDNVHCNITTRLTGQSDLQDYLGEGIELQWLKQVHGTEVVEFNNGASEVPLEADAAYSNKEGKACVVLTADCLPVFFCDEKGGEIAVAHAGWRGLAAGVLENTLLKFQSEPQHILAYLGPAIGPCHFEVGEEVRDIFLAQSGTAIQDEISQGFIPATSSGKWMADIYKLARARLKLTGLTKIYGNDICTYCSEKNSGKDFEYEFHSYRRNQTNNRLASIIWKS